MKYLIFNVLLLVFIGQVRAQEQLDTLTYSLFLVGDAGAVTAGQKGVFDIIKGQQAWTNVPTGLLFLGDNIYPQGMPPSYALDRQIAEAAIDAQLALAQDLKGTFYFIPGNHDWAQGRSYGWQHLRNQEQYIENKVEGQNVFLPDDGCPGPVEVALNEEITVIIIDTQWFLHGWSKPSGLSDCITANPVEVLQMMDDMIRRNRNANKKVIVATHHPMYSYGNHGGFNTLKDHFFPLTELAEPLYIPLPVIGSIYPLFRKIFGNIQDISHPTYQGMRNSMVNIFRKYPNLIHVSGHEHALEYAYADSIHYVVSGSGCKTEYVRTKGFAEYTESAFGFARLDFYKSGEVRVQYWRTKNNAPDGKLSFEKLLMKQPFEPALTPGEFVRKYDLKDSVVRTAASLRYESKSKFKKKVLGENYRKEWRQQINVPVFDIGREHGGLRIVQRGGGMQTKSLRLEATNGKQYVLRSIEKYPENAVPEFLRKTFAVDLVQDQISAAHPYGAFVVPELAKAAGVYHTNPRLVYIPNDPRLGDYQETFANTLAVYEERPDDDWSDADFFGNSEKIISTMKVLDKLADDNDNEVDQQFVLRSRLFDLVIGDWDRHDDQWRWATIDKKGEKGNIYRPIPRDRDQVFFVNEGFLPGIVSRKWALPKLEGFDYEVRWTPGLMFNARYFDRSFLTALSKEDWLSVAEQLQDSLTDESIERAIKQWPDSIYLLHGEEIIAKLKSRRNRLKEYALEHYLFLAKTVDVVGSDKHEHFSVERRKDGSVHVVVRKIKKDGDQKQVIYDRLFHADETNEIRLYGLGGEDVFEIQGEGAAGIKVRVIGGRDQDTMIDNSNVAGPARKNIFYDTKEGNSFNLNTESKDKTSDSPQVNNYDRRAFEYNVLMPLVTGNLNPDDGLFLGAGFMYTTQGFRKTPYKTRHKLLGSYAIKTSSYDFRYNGDFTDVAGSWDMHVDINVKQPNFVNNFFGLGNESEFDQNIDETLGVDDPIAYYRLRFSEVSSDISFSKKIGGFATFSMGGNMQAVAIEDPGSSDRFIQDFDLATGQALFGKYRTYAGGGIGLRFDKRNHPTLTTAGVVWDNRLSVMKGFRNSDNTFSSFNSELAFYYTFVSPSDLTVATRFGAGFNLGDYEFYQAQILDGKSELRGYRKTRFYGDSKLYNNLELRWRLFSFQTYIFPASFGVLAFNDVGRVWLDGEDSDTWHHGFGGGLWISPFNKTVLSSELAFSREETLFYVRFGFIF
ncbi:Surface antigen (D15) precursor [Fulvivirga imtechensis AK7]|uniref:Surface antigen (D15) n=1 Tax=Fulvivirga imtechensis AK7 TaxID=1237149 RepID=L8JXS5_9BACT|nr:BamA/TamA family outer membrane protein [Fulvivirga imtechensis]ELR72978.1 Surface antigen (D15) precursor [Fulvivirga imtechensis AK7]